MVSGGCRELVVIRELELESKLRAGLRGPHMPRSLGFVLWWCFLTPEDLLRLRPHP